VNLGTIWTWQDSPNVALSRVIKSGCLFIPNGLPIIHMVCLWKLILLTMERYTLGPLIYCDVRYHQAKHVIKLLNTGTSIVRDE